MNFSRKTFLLSFLLYHSLVQPALTVFLTDLTFLEDGNPDLLPENNLINFDKRRRIATVIKEIKQYQQTPYSLTSVPIIQGFLLAGGEYVDENKCYKLSVQVEPKNGKTKMKEGKSSWRNSSLTKKVESLNKRSMLMNVYSDPKESAKSAPVVSPTKHIVKSASGSMPTPNSIDLVESMVEGNSEAVDQYIESLQKTEEEKAKMREELLGLFEQRMQDRGALKVIQSISDGVEEEDTEIPFDELVENLKDGNTLLFEKFFEGLDIYKAERIRVQAYKMYEELQQQQQQQISNLSPKQTGKQK